MEFLWSLAIGMAAGFVLHRTHFCTMGAMTDLLLFGSKTRIKAWILAMGIAIMLTTGMRIQGLIDIDNTIYLEPSLGWMALLLGGWLFGFGMVLSGGCASRNLVRLGAGSLKALVVVLVMSVVAAATSFGALRWLPFTLDIARTPDLRQDGLGLLEIFGPTAGGVFGIGLAAAFIFYCLADKGLRSSPKELVAGISLGVLVPMGWLVSGSTLIQPSPDTVPQSLGYLIPAGELIRIVTSPFGLQLTFAIVALIGTLIGATISAITQRSFRFETFTNHSDMIRHLQGACLMGVGGVLAAGCTIGQGITGTSTLAPASFIALFAMLMGCRQALRFLETGRFFRFLKRA